MSSSRTSSPPLRFGCCGSMVSPTADPVGIEIVENLAELRFDYIELSLRDLVALPAPALADLIERLQRAGLGCEACNNFFPPGICLTGPTVDFAAALGYAKTALATAARVGASIVIFGSAPARNVPAGFPPGAAWTQLRDLLRALGPIAGRYGITIAIEHLNRGESNILNTVAESWRMTQDVAHPQIRLLVDAYHLRQENEDSGILARVAPAIAHVHVAQGAGRVFPDGHDAALDGFFGELRAANYAGRCSIEAFTPDFSTDAARALRVCRAFALPSAPVPGRGRVGEVAP